MQWRNSLRGYGAAVQIVHWFSVLLVGVAWVLGTVGEDLPRGRARDLGELIHVSAGELIAILLIFRVGWRLINAPPSPEPTPLGRLGDLAAKIVHLALYALLAAVVAVGVATQFADGDALSVLGIFDIASPWTKNKTFAHVDAVTHKRRDAKSVIPIPTLGQPGAACAPGSEVRNN